MLKIFTTQLTGYFKQIQEKEEFHIEDGARVLAQAIIGDGNIYIYGKDEMQAVGLEATKSQEPLPSTKLMAFEDIGHLTSADRVLLVSRTSTDPHILDLAQRLQEQGVLTVGISPIEKETTLPSLEDFVDAHIDTKLLKPLIPDDEGNRYGFPGIMTALYAYYGLHLTIKEIITEYE
ncbi:DUF2529 domain-containing protein [Priestia abyssalis]|uniref:DUF2529 domain-containing protein n=1 Tax=Priestia abyssalis TaxID=1221450 RepID=UPI000995A202|nr:DUF2529 domain-containing protein [Priestia abyssalis]